MKHVVVFFNAPGFDDYPFDEKDYRESYPELGEWIEQKGGQLFIARSMETYLGNSSFSRGWKYEQRGFVPMSSPVQADVIWNRGDFVGEADCDVVNNPELGEICANKWKTYKMFPELHPKTFFVNDAKDLEAALESLGSSQIVAKPVDSEGGKGVYIGSVDEVRPNVESYPYLIQEFIDTSGGIEGIARSVHDFRIVAIRGEAVLSYIREPKKGSLIANESRGGVITEVPIPRIPLAAMEVLRIVERTLARFEKRIYSLDMGLDRDGRWKIIEMNSQPGLDPSPKYEGAGRYIEKMAEMLME
jgi:glutathione synthase/RimK-type ligase-like ATP-grasp enzyme